MNQKIKVMKPAPQISDDEIRSYMDFDGVLKKQRAHVAKRNLYRGLAGVLIVSALAIVSSRFIVPSKSELPSNRSTVETLNEAPPQKNHSPVIDSASRGHENSLREKREQKVRNDEGTKPGPAESGKETKRNQVSPDMPVPTEQKNKGEDIYFQAEPVEGYDNLYAYFHKNLKYPHEAMKDSIQGAVVVVFVIKADGTAGDIQVRSNIGEPFVSEVVQLIENMPAWRPASLNGIAVPSRMTLPLTFQIERIKK